MTAKPLGVVADVGGTNARFAIAVRGSGGQVLLEHLRTLRTADHPSFETAYRAYVDDLPFRPARGVFALAGPIVREEVRLTNSPWVLRHAALADRIGLDQARLLNDFEAVANGVAALAPEDFRTIGDAAFAIPTEGVVSIVGPGSGLGVALVHRTGGESRIVATEGGHVGFAPADEIDIQILRFLLERYPRVSAERLISGPGLVQIYVALAELEGRAIVPPHTVPLWEAAIAGTDQHAVAAAERWLMLLGTIAGDIVLAHGAAALVLAGGILPRFGAGLDTGLLLARFRAKGRFETLMHDVSMAMVTHPEPGLLGAATLLARDD